MKATLSRTTGVCIYGTAEAPNVVFAPDSRVLDPDLDRHMICLANDWEIVEATSDEALLREASEAYYVERARALVQVGLALDDDEQKKDILQDVETALATRVRPARLVARLLIAPLVDPQPMEELASLALSRGFPATAKALSRVVELQPLLHRFVKYWLSLPVELFGEFSGARSELWQRLSSLGQIPLLLEARAHSAFTNLFGPLMFGEQSVAKRKTIVTIARELEKRLQIGDDSPSTELDYDEKSGEESQAESAGLSHSGSRHVPSTHRSYQRALSQVNAIVKAVAEGKDYRAQEIMKQLIDTQVSIPGGRKYAVKSLCNVAQQCAELFRTDFERMALEKAIDVDPTDGWTRMQLGDHLKRVGQYQHAEQVLTELINEAGDQSPVARSALADVHAQRGELELAIEMYKRLPDWENTPEVRTAIADNLRRLGRFREASQAYVALEEEGFISGRTQAGRAEIAKRLGSYAVAENIYREVIFGEPEPHARRIYQLALIGVLKQQMKLDDAYQYVEELIAEAPFCMPARLLRAAILGLMDEEEEALSSLPDSGAPRAYGEWLQQYYHGLLLLKLERYADARARLVENLDAALVTSDEREIARLAAAFAFLANDELVRASEILAKMGAVHDRYVEHLQRVLRLHLAVAQQDNDRTSELIGELKRQHIKDKNLAQAVKELERGNLVRARRFELKALLALAA